MEGDYKTCPHNCRVTYNSNPAASEEGAGAGTVGQLGLLDTRRTGPVGGTLTVGVARGQRVGWEKSRPVGEEEV